MTTTFWQRWLFNPDINPQDPRHFHADTNPYPAGPAGQNGTQQFAKLSDDQLFAITRDWAAKGFWGYYYDSQDTKESTRRIINNLPTITKEAVNILITIQKKYGYTPNETVGAIKRYLWTNQMIKRNPAMRMFVVAFGIASILIEVNSTDQKGTDQHRSQKDKQANDLIERLKQFDAQIEEYKRQHAKAKRDFEKLYED